MPAITVTEDLTDPSSSLTAGTKYVVQNQGYASVRIRVSATAFTAKTSDSLTLGTGNSVNTPSQLEYTYEAADNIRLWAEGGDTLVVFHELS